MLLVLFIDDTVNYADNSVTIKMCADDTKLYTVISCELSAARLQSCLVFPLAITSYQLNVYSDAI